MTFKIDDLANVITEQVKEYTNAVEVAIPPIVDKTTKDILGDIRSNAPKRTGKYAKGWRQRKMGDRTRSKNGYMRRIYNPKYYFLAHLLEYGHAKKGGGRTKAKAHLRPACDKYLPKMEKRIEQTIKQGGR